MLMLENKVERTMARIDTMLDKSAAYATLSTTLTVIGGIALYAGTQERNAFTFILGLLCFGISIYYSAFKMRELDDEFRERTNNLRNYIDFLGKTDEEKEKEKRCEDGNIERLRNLIPHNKK